MGSGLFISRPLLWPYLDCRDADKTRTYIERLTSTPLEIWPERLCGNGHVEDTSLPMAHISTD